MGPLSLVTGRTRSRASDRVECRAARHFRPASMAPIRPQRQAGECGAFWDRGHPIPPRLLPPRLRGGWRALARRVGLYGRTPKPHPTSLRSATLPEDGEGEDGEGWDARGPRGVRQASITILGAARPAPAAI